MSTVMQQINGGGGNGPMKVFSHDELPGSDLILDAVYEGAAVGNLKGEAISKLLPGVGNLGGFRFAGRGAHKKFAVLYSSGEDPDWPDHLDLETGLFTYYGDNKTPGHELHETKRGGNALLRDIFGMLHAIENQRAVIPPFFVFRKHPTSVSSYSIMFSGLAVPGAPSLPATSDLLAIWKTTKGQRFQNYRAVFTILDIPVVSRAWVKDLIAGNPMSAHAPKVWKEWVKTGRYRPLFAKSTTTIRSIEEQTPSDDLRGSILSSVWSHFSNLNDNFRRFEAFAARIFQMLDQRVIIDEITRGVVDGGRDAIGRYLLGVNADPIYVEFALEAKCYRPVSKGLKPTIVNVEDVARLVSRLRHRQFGVLVTTSAIARQAYKEVRADGHPIVFICGKDIADILVMNGYKDQNSVQTFLDREFPIQ